MVFFGQLWMGLFVGVVIFLYQFLVVYIRGDHVWQNRVSSNIHRVDSISRAASIESNNHVRSAEIQWNQALLERLGLVCPF